MAISSIRNSYWLRSVRCKHAREGYCARGHATDFERGCARVPSRPWLLLHRREGRASYKRPPRPSGGGAVERKLTLEERFMEEYKPPAWVSNRYVWVAIVVFGVGLALYSASLR